MEWFYFVWGFDKGIGECEKGLSLIRSCTEYLMYAGKVRSCI